MTICYIPIKSNVVTDTLSYFPELAAVIGLVESSLLIQIHQAKAAASGDLWD